MIAPFLYGGPLAEAISAIKFRSREDLAHALGRLLLTRAPIRDACQAADLIVPIPLSAARQRERGFNQSAILARELSRFSKKPVVHALRRIRNTSPQSDLPLSQRRGNVEHAFTARKKVTGHCLLVDDVVTSGETVRQAAAALLDAGAPSVVVAALARTALQD